MLHADIRNPLNRFCCSCVRDEESLIDDGKFECYPRKVGGSFLLYGKKKSYFPFHCSVGPDWIMVVLVFTIIIVANVVVLYIVSPLGWPPVLLGAVGAILLLCAYSGAAFTDPGTVFENDYSQIGAGSIEVANLNSGDHAGDNKLGGDSMTSPINVTRPNNNVRTMECGQCQFQRPLTARHCVYCQSCIDHLDHHCPWCGRCIGDNNLKCFHYFLQLICFQFYFLLGTFIYYMLYAFADVGLPAGPSFRQ